ncbi:ABC transporter permease [Leekyejoonella antrihumi]|uniref:Xylose transport system permease protein XylH n=1 Tax=Leekyejoonella antrihumi TaxID=1660198 RepID=A0A563E978_9MICO|nr:ABC transporter permease [Leekyejoonella antrihumi]
MDPNQNPTDDRVGARSLSARTLSRPEIGALLGAIAVAILFLAVAPAFREVPTVGTILYQSATIGIMTVPVSLLMIGGEFDLSAGVAVTSSGLATALITWEFGLNVWTGVGIGLVVSLAIGAFNGWILHLTGLHSFLVTLGSFFILQGANLGLTQAIAGGVSSPNLQNVQGWDSAQSFFAGSVTIGSLPLQVPILFWIVLVIIGAYVLLRTRVGNWIFAVGGDAEAARAAGVPVFWVKMGLFMAVGFCAWLLGMHMLFNYNNVQSGNGVGNEFIYIIAAVIGGCLLDGGLGSVIGGAIGALIFGMTQLGITYAGWDPDWFKAFLGAMLLLATVVNLIVRKKADQK